MSAPGSATPGKPASSVAPGAPSVAQIGLLAATALVVANMIGTGIFTGTGYFAAAVPDGGAVVLGWAIGGAIALCGATAYAELGAMMPRGGGEYVYLREAYHPLLGALSGWVSLWAGFSAPIASQALLFEKYLGTVVPGIPDKVAAIALIALMTVLHGVDVAFGSRVQTVFTALKVALIVVFIGAGLLVGDGDFGHFAATGTGSGESQTTLIFSGVFAVQLIYVGFAYSGWNAAAYIAGEIRDPRRNVPRALLLGTGIVTVLYVGLNIVYFYAAAPADLAGKHEVADVAARALFGDTAGDLLSTLIALALVSAVSAMVMAGPRVYAAMAEDGAFFPVFAARNRRGAPTWSVILQGALAIVICLVGDLAKIIGYVGFTLGVSAALTVAAVIVLRVRRPDAPRPYRTFGYPVTPVLFIAVSGWIVYWSIDSNPTVALWGLGTLGSGALVTLVISMVNRGRPRS